MAKVIQSEQRYVAESRWTQARTVLIGTAVGASWWMLATILQRYVIEPLACRHLSSAAACVDSFGTAGSIAAILAALLGIILLVRALQRRPILIALLSGALLWDLGSLSNGLSWWVTLLAAIGLYTASYSLFRLTTKPKSTLTALLVSIGTLIAIRIIVNI